MRRRPQRCTTSCGPTSARRCLSCATWRTGSTPRCSRTRVCPPRCAKRPRAAIPAELRCDGAGRYPTELEAAVYFCCLEALQNAAKHAGAGAKVTIDLAERDRRLVFAVADDGRGYDTGAGSASVGVQNMTDRIGALGGELTVESAPGAGTTILGSISLTS